MTSRRPHRESGQVVVFFALFLGVLFGLGAIVIAIGNWYTHARHLQTKADAGALAGGGMWEFPCGPQIDQRIEDEARRFIGPHTRADGTLYTGTVFNPQVGGVSGSQIRAVLNGTSWYDDDSSPSVADRTSPANASLCASMTLDVKLTEDNSFPLFSLIPLYPDIKRKARVEIREAEGITGLLPIAVRAPEPLSAAAVFYDENTGNIRAVRYFVKNSSISGLPGGLQGWTTFNPEDPNTWASFAPTSETGVVIATSYRGACATNLPAGNTRIATTAAPCFEDQGFTTVNQLCNQGSTVPIVTCYAASGNWPSQQVASGLHFIRGYPATTPGTGPPGLEGAHLEYLSCSYFGYHPNNECQARLRVTLDLGTLVGTYPNPNPPPGQVQGPLRASDVEVRFRLVRDDGSSQCTFGSNCDLLPDNASGTGTVTFATTGSNASPHLRFPARSGRNAVAIQVRLRNAQNHTNANCRNANFNNNCRWYYLAGDGVSTRTNEPSEAAILAAPVQRAFRSANSPPERRAGSVQWLRLTANDCAGGTTYIDNEAASRPSGSASCFIVDLGLKGGVARDADEPALLFDDGTGSSQVGALDCDPSIPQGQAPIDGVRDGCNVWYGRHPFDWSPLCPDHNRLFEPNPGPPWNDGRWPPLRCVKTLPRSTANQFERGFKGRLFGNEHQSSCPADRNDFVMGRNYWKQGTNMDARWGYKDDNPLRDTRFHPADPRLVTIFLTTPEAFGGSGQQTYPITGFISVYVTGFGRVQ
ncbi:MAG: pilus assembly protein TadG-related protein, partial [Thermoleophilia bacterium]|nr:pilus assembly protein TadG-related protein [Thermoleophilia bacterium]